MRGLAVFAFSLVLVTGHAAPPIARPAPPDPDSTQQTVPRVGNFLSLSTILNFGRGAVRVLAIVAPSSPDAETAMETVEALLRDIPSKRLRVYVVLSHAGADDTQIRALDLASRHRDRRIVYLWDPEGLVATAMGPVSGGERADGVLFLYDTDATFTTAPAEPLLWLRLAPAGGEPLERDALLERASGLVRDVERKASDAILKGE